MQNQNNTKLYLNYHEFNNKFSVINSTDELLKLAKYYFPKNKLYIIKLIKERIHEFHKEEPEEVNIDSLKSMLLFLYNLDNYTKPNISISDDGIFYVDWEKHNNDSLTTRFKSNFMVEFSLFQSNSHNNKLAIRNGFLFVLDFISDLYKLDIMTFRN